MAAFASLASLCAGARPDKGRGVAALLQLEASPAAAGGAAVKAGVVLVLVAALSSGVAVVITGDDELPSLLSAAVRKLRLQARCVPLLLPGACGSHHRQRESVNRGQQDISPTCPDRTTVLFLQDRVTPAARCS